MHILVVTNHFWPENFRINDLALGMVERGHEVTVLTGIPNYPEGKFYPGYGLFRKRAEEYRGIKIHRIPLIPRGSGSTWHLLLNYVSSAIAFCFLAPFLCRKKFDVVFVFETSPATIGLPAVLLKWIYRKPLIFWVLDIWPDSISATNALKNRYVLWLIRKIVRQIYLNCDELLISSKGFERRVQSVGGFKGDIKYFPNWVEREMGGSKSTSSNGVEFPKGFRILFTGNVGMAQDFPTILDAAERLKGIADLHWIIVGNGRNLEWVKSEIARRDLNSQFHLLGRHPVEMMPQFFSEADVLLLSLRKEPIFELTAPGKLQSYMSSGVPILAALDGEGANIVNEAQCGIACGAGDSESLTKAVLSFYQMPKPERIEMGIRGQRYCEKHFSRELLFDQLELLFHQSIKGATK